jgi:hypothetical protein
MLTKKEVALLQKELASSQNPLIYYDDDPDGLCSFLLLYRKYKEGTGIIVKSSPKVDMKFLRQVEERQPDKIFILDMPMVEQEFVDKAKRPIFWIDHHHPQNLKNVNYFNPKLRDPDIYMPTSRMAYQIAEQDLWVAAVGCLADYHMPDFMPEFIKKYPKLLPEETDLPTAIYHRPVGKLVRIFSFLLKGNLHDVKKCVKILTRIKSPDEILQQTTPQGKFLYKRFLKFNKPYEDLLKLARKQVTRSKVLLFQYTEDNSSFTPDLANELSNLYPKKVIIIARNKSGEMKCSLRAKFAIDKALERALVGIDGYGGGHPNACGTVVREMDWEKFLKNFKRELP